MLQSVKNIWTIKAKNIWTKYSSVKIGPDKVLLECERTEDDDAWGINIIVAVDWLEMFEDGPDDDDELDGQDITEDVVDAAAELL